MPAGNETRLACALLSGPGANEGRDGERAAGEVFERWSEPEGLCRDLVGDDSLCPVLEGVLGKREKPGLLAKPGEVALRPCNRLSLSSISRS